MQKIKIAVASHKPYRMPSSSLYLPLHVGAALHPDICSDMQGDDVGDNISLKNASYSELTGLYWMWKNCKADYKGLVHYRRHLGSPNPLHRRSKDRFERIVAESELASLLKSAEIIVAKKRNYYIETVYSHYAHTFEASHFDTCREILEDRYPDYVPAWDHLMSSRSAHIFNMFIMRADLFNEYCSWMFPVVEELESRIGVRQYDAFNARFPGRVSERLLDPWIETNHLHFIELPMVSMEPVDWISKAGGFLQAKFFGKKYKRSF